LLVVVSGMTDENDVDSRAEAGLLVESFNADFTHDLTRVLRIAGTMNFKIPDEIAPDLFHLTRALTRVLEDQLVETIAEVAPPSDRRNP
jgi:hypothetical protein